MPQLDVIEFRKFLRITRDEFEEIHNFIQADITKQYTSFRTPILSREKLAVCLRYHLHGRMASIIKNQILKYLSRYFKNLSTDKINFSTIKGEGELAQLELDEIALTDLLDLPAWMRITSAMCNRVTFQIPWTKLKSEPMIWNLDEVRVKVETCEELRTPDEALPNLLQSPGKYNFIIKTVDGMTINVNTVFIDFSSSTFTASLQILRIIVESTSSAWEKCDLRHTRIKDSKRGQILLFKEVRWQNLRIEAKSIIEQDLPPIRLLTNETALCRIVIKKRLSDCFIMGSKLVFILKELLWVLTDSQLKAALHFLDSLSGLIKKANEVVRKKKAARKLEMLPEYQAQVSQQETMQKKSVVSHIFSCHDVIETSYHFIAQKIHLHLSDDPGPERSIHPELMQGASIHVQLSSVQIDYYPYHLAIKDRDHWGLYKTSRYPHPQWLSQSQNEFRNALLSLVQDDFSTDCCSISKTNILQNGVSYQSRPTTNNNLRNYLMARFNKIMTSCTVLRIGDFVVHRVTSKKELPREFIKADKDRYKLPETEIIHAEFTYYYYPGDIQFPLPPPKFYVQIYPVQIQFDVLTIIWLNNFFLNLHKSVLTTATIQGQQTAEFQLFYFDVRIEVTMPQVIFDSAEEKHLPKDRPRTFQIEVSKISVTNTRSNGTVSSRSNLAKVVNTCQLKSLFLSDDFPSKSSDFAVLTDKFINHVQGKDNVRNFPSKLLSAVDNEEDIAKSLSQELLWIDAKDVWCVHLESVWGDFGGVRAVGNSTVPFLDAFPLTVWLHMDTLMSNMSNYNLANIHVLASVTNLISVQINKYQAMFLSKLLKSFSELTTFLTLDADNVTKGEKSASLVVVSVIPQIEITLVTSSQGNGKESSGGDVESSSVVPDSSSFDAHSVYWSGTMQNSLDTSNAAGDIRKSIVKCKTEPGYVIAQSHSSQWEVEENTKGGHTFSQLKKNISNFMSIDFSKSVDDNSDSLSVRSDDSSDTENYLMRSGSDQLYLDDADAMFKLNCKKKVRSSALTAHTPNIEIADEALNENMIDSETPTTVSGKDSIVSGWKRKDNVAATTLRLHRLEYMMQTVGLVGSLKMQIDNVSLEECFSIPWDELQSKFSSRIRNWCEVDDIKSELVSNARIKLRMESEIHCPDFSSAFMCNVEQWRDSRLRVIVKDLSLEVQPQTLKCLAELLEDQKLDNGGKPVSFEILVDNVQILFKDDCVDTYDEYATPSPLIFKRLQLLRENNTINIQPYDVVSVSNTAEDVSADRIKSMTAEIELLRKKLTAMNYLKEENLALRQYEEETKLLRSCLTAAQNQIAHLLDERRKMVECLPRVGSSYVSDSASCKR